MSENARQEVVSQALEYLQQHTVMTLATSGPNGPWAAAVFYASDGFDLYFLSAGHTRHATDLARDPHVAATIQENYLDWPEIKGIQLEGVVVQLIGEERSAAMRPPWQWHPCPNYRPWEER